MSRTILSRFFIFGPLPCILRFCILRSCVMRFYLLRYYAENKRDDRDCQEDDKNTPESLSNTVVLIKDNSSDKAPRHLHPSLLSLALVMKPSVNTHEGEEPKYKQTHPYLEASRHNFPTA